MSGPSFYEQYPQPPEPAPLPVPVNYAIVRSTDQQPVSTPVVVVAWIVTVFTSLYMLPWAIAASRGKANQWTVFLISFLLGWTIVGWIVALVMSCTRHRPLAGYAPYAALPPQPSAPPAGWYANPGGPGRRYWDGAEWTQHYSA